MYHKVVTASWRRRPNRGPCRGRHVVHCRRRHPGLPHHGSPEAEVGGQVQASLAGVDLSSAAAGQSHQASSRGEAYLKVICDTHLSTWPKWSTPPKPPAPAPAPVFSGLLNIVAPVVAGLLVLGIGCLMCLVIMVRKKRSLHGTYNPREKEIDPRNQPPSFPMDVFKKPAEERLI